MKNWSIAAGLVLAASNVCAADFGIGVSAKSDDAWIYAPIQISPTFRLEPSIRHYDAKSTTADGAGGFDGRSSRKTRTLEAGLGAFRLSKVAESAQLYYGARAAYVDTETSTVDVYTAGMPYSYRAKSTQDGYRLSAVLGFEYLFTEHFSIGGEATYGYLDTEGDAVITSGGIVKQVERSDIDQRNFGTDTQLIIRYMF